MGTSVHTYILRIRLIPSSIRLHLIVLKISIILNRAGGIPKHLFLKIKMFCCSICTYIDFVKSTGITNIRENHL